MANEIISRRLRSLLEDYLSSNSILREIDSEFEAAEIRYVPLTTENSLGQRRTLVRGYYNGLNFEERADARKFLTVLAVFMSGLETKVENDPHNYNSYLREGLSAFQKQLNREGYQYQNGTITPITAEARLADAKAIAASFDATHMTDQIHRIEASIDVDPALAIGTAKELAESCFKTILGDRNIEYSSSDDLLQLAKKVFRTLKLVADDIPNSAKGADTIKRLLNNLSTVVQGLAELRGLYGTGHGKDGRTRGITPRHARLAVGAAAALVTFVFQTHLETRASRDLKS